MIDLKAACPMIDMTYTTKMLFQQRFLFLVRIKAIAISFEYGFVFRADFFDLLLSRQSALSIGKHTHELIE
jgi:hypothetical protein